MRRLIAVILFCAGMFCLAQSNAQMPLTGAGRGAPGGAAPSYTGPGDCSGCLTTYNIWYGLSAFSAATAGTKAANICNASAVCADVDTLTNGKFDVATAQGGTLHCGGIGGQCTVAKFYDKSGNSNDCTVGTGVVNLIFSALGSFPSLNFNSGTPGFCGAGSTINLPTPTTYVAVLAFNSGDSFHNALYNDGSVPALSIPNGAASIGMIDTTFGFVITASASAGTFYAVTGIWNTTSSALYLNGAATTGTTAATAQTGATMRVGDAAFLGQYFEVGVQANAAPNSTQAAAYSSNRRAFYGN